MAKEKKAKKVAKKAKVSKKGKRPTPDEAMAITRAGVPENKKVKIGKEGAKASKAHKKKSKKEKRKQVEKDIKRDAGVTQRELDVLFVEMYDELANVGLVKKRANRRRG